MTNQQGAPEALRPIQRFNNVVGLMNPEARGLYVRYEDHIAAMVRAQQPAPSAAAMNFDPHAELRKTWQPGQRWQTRTMRHGVWGDWSDTLSGRPLWFAHQQYRRHPDEIATQPSTPHGQVPASSAVLKAIREANMQLVRTGDDTFVLVTYKNARAQSMWGAVRSPAAPPAR